MTRLLILAVALAFLGGCRTGDPVQDSAADQNTKDSLMILKEGHARGHLSFSTGGSPFSAGAKTIFFLGPENAGFAFDGDVDFTRGEIPASDLMSKPDDEGHPENTIYDADPPGSGGQDPATK